jgi:hypothetical protein
MIWSNSHAPRKGGFFVTLIYIVSYCIVTVAALAMPRNTIQCNVDLAPDLGKLNCLTLIVGFVIIKESRLMAHGPGGYDVRNRNRA